MSEAQGDSPISQLNSQLPPGERFGQLRNEVRTHLTQAREVLEKRGLQRKLTEADFRLAQLSTAVELTRESGKNETDEKTGIYRRDALIKHIKEEAKLENRLIQQGKGYPSTTVFIDLDGLKRINDTEGHNAGDKYISDFVEFIRGTVRNSDYLGRFGGDEFVVLLRGTDFENAQLWLEKVKQAMSKTNLSASIGMHPFDPSNVDQSISSADKAMYVAKEQHYKETGIERRTSS